VAWSLALILVLSVLCNWVVWRMFRMADLNLHAPAVIADVPDYTLDWRGLI
jgi:hypothetical protein